MFSLLLVLLLLSIPTPPPDNLTKTHMQNAAVLQDQAHETKNDIATISHDAQRAVFLIVVSDARGREIGQGSGVVVSDDGKVITNYHVIDGANSAVIKFPNGAFFLIEGVLAADVQKDIAVLKASGSDFPTVAMGDSDKVQVGEEVVSIGSTLSLEATVSNGIISSIRELKDKHQSLFQTTAPISPGSSGGALLNMRGELIGITTAEMVGGQNLNFAVPINVVKPLLSASSPRKLVDKPTVNETPSGRAVQRLGEVKSIAFASFGQTRSALIVREKLINRLAKSDRLNVVDDPSQADAVLNGVVTENVYGIVSTAAFRLDTQGGHILWSGESLARDWGSANSHVAEKIANDLLSSIERDNKRKK
jgi:S1-C subfamily serine protease